MISYIILFDHIPGGVVQMKMKKQIVTYVLIVAIVLVLVFLWNTNRIIGKMSGPENEYVVFNNGTTYALCDDHHSFRDKGWVLGRVSAAYNTSYYVFSVRGDSDREYIYIAAMGKGEFYKRTNS